MSYKVLLNELFEAYFDCRRSKRNTANALRFELNHEEKIHDLCNDLYNGTYEIGRSIAFIVDYPVKREIFAADFRDRVVHHWLINKLNGLFEKIFITDSYGCREGKGTLYGIHRLQAFMRSATRGGAQKAYILKMDIQGFFMNIDRELLCKYLLEFIDKKYTGEDKERVKMIANIIAWHDPVDNCYIKGKQTNWDGLPLNKSLLLSNRYQRKSSAGSTAIGVPIGNLTSQVFANFYLHPFDHWMKHTMQLKYYGRYVDDIVVVHHDLEFLQTIPDLVKNFLWDNLRLTLHPKKIKIQPCEKGILFLGGYVKPNYTTVGNRTKGRFYEKIQAFNNKATFLNGRLNSKQQKDVMQSLNAYLGTTAQHKSYKMRRKMIGRLSKEYEPYLHLSEDAKKMMRPVVNDLSDN